MSSCSEQAGWGLTNTGPFSNLQPFFYWSGTTYAPDPRGAWGFNFQAGVQGATIKFGPPTFHAWAVRSGDIAEVPVPAAVWMMPSGALALLGLVRRRARTVVAA